jgi:hypothetical protein
VNRLLILNLSLLALFAVCALVTKSSVLPAMIVAVILVSSFLFCHSYDRSVLHMQLRLAEAESPQAQMYRDVWLSAQAPAQQRLHEDEEVLFAAIAALAIVAAAPRRREEAPGSSPNSV